MLTLDDLKAHKSIEVNTRSANGVYREINNDELTNAVLGDVINRKAIYKLDPDAGACKQVTHGLYQIMQNDCDNLADITHVVVSNIINTHEKLQKAYSKGHDKNIATSEQQALGICMALKSLQSGLGKNSFYRHNDAVKFETAGADAKMNVKSDYDGFQNVQYGSTQINEVSDALYDELTGLYSAALGLLEKNKGLLDLAKSFPYISVKRDNANIYDEFFDRQSYFTSMIEHRVNSEPDAKEAVAGLVGLKY